MMCYNNRHGTPCRYCRHFQIGRRADQASFSKVQTKGEGHMPLGLIGGGLGVLVLVIAITRLVKAWNAPKVAAAEAEAAAIKAQAADEKRDDKSDRRQNRLDHKKEKP